MSAIAAIVPDWPAPSRVRGLATLRSSPGVSLPPFGRCNLGARGGDDPALVAANRAGLPEAFGLPSPPWWLHQVHGTGVLRVDAPPSDAVPLDAEPQADAAVAGTAGVVLAVLSADCLPVLFAADDGSAVGAAHAGWRGLAAGVLERTVEALGAAPRRVLAWLGPAIGPASYEVGIEVRDAFVADDPDASAAFAPTRPGHWTCDCTRWRGSALHAPAWCTCAAVATTPLPIRRAFTRTAATVRAVAARQRWSGSIRRADAFSAARCRRAARQPRMANNQRMTVWSHRC